MKKPKITRLKTDDPKAIKMVANIRKAIEDGKNYVKAHGGNSTEGFYRTPDGPRSIE